MGAHIFFFGLEIGVFSPPPSNGIINVLDLTFRMLMDALVVQQHALKRMTFKCKFMWYAANDVFQ